MSANHKLNPGGIVVGLLLRLVGKVVTINSQAVRVLERDTSGNVSRSSGAFAVTDGGAGFAVGAIHIKSDGTAGSVFYVNEGDATTCDFNPVSFGGSQAITATDAGLTTGAMSAAAFHAAVTSSASTKQVALPASSAALVGKTFTIWVGANGFELITPATSGATINGTDADGTNQADIPANTLSRVTLVAADTWLLENIGANGTVAAAIVPDND